MAFFIATLIYVLLYNGLVWATIGNEMPMQCYGSSTAMGCYPVIPSYVQFFGWDLPNVETLALHNGNDLKWSLQTLPSGLFKWASNIKYISMKDVGLENLKCDIFKPLKNSLHTIYMSNNLFRKFPVCALKNLNQLKYIDFSNQNIDYVNIDYLDSNYLTGIALHQNKISNFSISNINSNNDIQIYLNNNEITYLNISRVNRIKYLSVKKNQLKVIYREIFKNSRSTLSLLHLSYNALDDDVWNVLEGVTSLGELDLQHNRLQTVSPSVINRLSELYYLDLSHNLITSLTDVLLRSGNMNTILFNSNKLVNFPPDIIHEANTFYKYYCTLDISNNMLDNIQLNMSKTTRLTLNLGQNELTNIHFNTNDNEIESLNISSNRLVTLPETLPKAKRYIISNNPLKTTNVLKHLRTTMKDATQIEMDDINFLCNKSEQYNFTNLQLSKIVTFFLRRNCIPLMFLCHIGNSYTNIYLDNNKHHSNSTKDMPCELHTKRFGIFSFSGSRINETFVNFFMLKNNNTISNVNSLYVNKSQLRELPFMKYAGLPYGDHVIDFSENYLEAFNGLENTVSDSFTLNLENNRITKFEKVTWKTNGDVYLRSLNLKYMHNYIAIVNGSFTLIEFIGEFRYIYISIDLSYNRLHEFDLAAVLNSNNYHSYFMVQNLNMSHNELEVIRGCLHKSRRFYKVDYTYNKFRELPQNSCHYATETYLGHNKITEIPRTLPTSSINKLDLEWNLIQYISEKAFTNLASLRTLNLKGNKLKHFPKAVQKLLYLTTLDISYNEIINIKQSDIDGQMYSLTSLILTGNDLTSYPSKSFGLQGYVTRLELKDNLIYCDCGVQFLRNSTLNTQGRCSFPPEFEGYFVSCFPADNCVGNVPIYVYKETKLRCLNDDYFDVKISVSEDDENRLVSWKRIGPKNQKSLRLMAYREQKVVKEILINETGQTYYFLLPSSLNADRLCVYAFLEERPFKRCLDVNSTYIKSRSVSETNSNNGAIYGTSTALVLSVLLNIFGSIFIFAFIKRTRTKSVNEANSNRFDNNAYVPNEYEMSSCRRGACDQQVEVYDELSENCYNTGKETYENLKIGNVRT